MKNYSKLYLNYDSDNYDADEVFESKKRIKKSDNKAHAHREYWDDDDIRFHRKSKRLRNIGNKC